MEYSVSVAACFSFPTRHIVDYNFPVQKMFNDIPYMTCDIDMPDTIFWKQ